MPARPKGVAGIFEFTIKCNVLYDWESIGFPIFLHRLEHPTYQVFQGFFV